jgi:hypothetical protein
MLLISIWYGADREEAVGDWDDVRAFVEILEPGCGCTAILARTLSGDTVMQMQVPSV